MLAALTPAVSAAQDRPVHVNFGGGPTFIGGNLGDHFGTGWGPAIGVTFNLNPKLAFQFEYAYRRFAINDSLDAAAGVLDANHQTHQLDFNLVFNLSDPDSSKRVYLMAGPGAYFRSVQITKYEGSGIICDPYWYVCGSYPIESIVGDRGGWDFGFNVGGGIGFKFDQDAEFYIEARYHYVAGPEFNPSVQPIGQTLKGGSTTGHYFPLTFGFRF